jgi:predicted restriction endonuclease
MLQGSLAAAIKLYGDYLAFKDLADDIEAASDAQTHVHQTESERFAPVRHGQGVFRNELLSRHQRCELCGLTKAQLLVASHIKPWSIADDYERLDINNGLLLCANHDVLFDRGFITFDHDRGGSILVSSGIHKHDYPKLLLSSSLALPLKGMRAHYMDYHLKNSFQQ